jgi:hypothetical protein
LFFIHALGNPSTGCPGSLPQCAFLRMGTTVPRILLSFAPFGIFVPGDPLFGDQFLCHTSNAQRHGTHYVDFYRIIILKTTFRAVDSSHAKEVIYDHWLNMTFTLFDDPGPCTIRGAG